MRSRKLIPLCLLPVLLAGAACTHLDPVPTGEVTLTFRAGQAQTRAVTPGDGEILDGGGIYHTGGSGTELDPYVPDLVILIADADGTIVLRYPDSDGTDEMTSSTTSVTDTEASIRFTGLTARQTYSVYAVANLTNISATKTAIDGECTTIEDLDALKLTAPTSPAGTPPVTVAPTFATCMPLSAKGSITVNASGNGQATLELLRVVAKVQLSFKNLTGDALTLHNCQVTLHDMNVSEGWLFPASPDCTGDYRDHTLSVERIPSSEAISASSSAVVFDNVLFYPSVAPAKALPTPGNRYLVDIAFRIKKTGKIYDADDDATYDAYSYSNLPVFDSNSDDIPALGRNQFLKIETVISKRGETTDPSFNFEVANWNSRTETVIFH